MRLDQKGTAMAEYIWIDSFGGVRSKSKVSSCVVSFPPSLSRTHKPRAQSQSLVLIACNPWDLGKSTHGDHCDHRPILTQEIFGMRSAPVSYDATLLHRHVSS